MNLIDGAMAQDGRWHLKTAHKKTKAAAFSRVFFSHDGNGVYAYNGQIGVAFGADGKSTRTSPARRSR